MVVMMMITEIMLLRKSFGRRPPRYVVVIIVSERTSSTSLLRPEWVYRLLSSLVTWVTRSTQRRGGSIISSSRRWLRSLLQSLFSSMDLQQAREEVTPGFSFFSPFDGFVRHNNKKGCELFCCVAFGIVFFVFLSFLFLSLLLLLCFVFSIRRHFQFLHCLLLFELLGVLLLCCVWSDWKITRLSACCSLKRSAPVKSKLSGNRRQNQEKKE